MAEIHLPTKVTQDSIKQDTEFIKGQFPIEGGTDFTKGTSFYETFLNTTTGTTPHTIFEITGRGIVDHITIRSGSSQTHYTIEADGRKVLPSNASVIYINPSSTREINLFFGFSNRFVIKASATDPQIEISYTLF